MVKSLFPPTGRQPGPGVSLSQDASLPTRHRVLRVVPFAPPSPPSPVSLQRWPRPGGGWARGVRSGWLKTLDGRSQLRNQGGLRGEWGHSRGAGTQAAVLRAGFLNAEACSRGVSVRWAGAGAGCRLRPVRPGPDLPGQGLQAASPGAVFSPGGPHPSWAGAGLTGGPGVPLHPAWPAGVSGRQAACVPAPAGTPGPAHPPPRPPPPARYFRALLTRVTPVPSAGAPSAAFTGPLLFFTLTVVGVHSGDNTLSMVPVFEGHGTESHRAK